MPSSIDKLLSYPEIVGAKKKPQAPQDVLDDLAAQFKATIPESLLRFWRAAGGVKLKALDAHIPVPSR
jgi:hypothetical protein